MKKVLVILPDDMAKELRKSPNMSQTIRDALAIYNEHISTDTIQGLRKSYDILLKRMDERFTAYDEKFERMDKLLGYLETRM